MKRQFCALLLLLILAGCSIDKSGFDQASYIYPPWRHTWGIRRATPFKLRLFVGNKTHFNNPQGMACVVLKSWDNLNSGRDDDEVTVFGVNSGDNCVIYNKSRHALGVYGLEKNHEQLRNPWGIAADERGNVFVADRGTARIVRLFYTDSGLKYIGEFGTGQALIPLVDPRGLALDAAGNLYVTDTAMGDVVIFDSSGAEAARWEGLIQPEGLAVVGPDEEFLFNRLDAFAVVCDSLKKRLTKFSLTGEQLASIRVGDRLPADWEFGWPVIDYHSQILVTDAANGCIHKFSTDLDLLTSFGKSGKGYLEFDEPRGIALHRRLGQIFIAEREGAQYLWTGVEVRDLRASVRTDSIWRDLEVRFNLTEPALGEIEVLDHHHRFITRIASGRRFPSGANYFSWSMMVPDRESAEDRVVSLPPRIHRGQPLPAGSYLLEAKFRASFCSTKYFSRRASAEFTVQEAAPAK